MRFILLPAVLLILSTSIHGCASRSCCKEIQSVEQCLSVSYCTPEFTDVPGPDGEPIWWCVPKKQP